MIDTDMRKLQKTSYSSQLKMLLRVMLSTTPNRRPNATQILELPFLMQAMDDLNLQDIKDLQASLNSSEERNSLFCKVKHRAYVVAVTSKCMLWLRRGGGRGKLWLNPTMICRDCVPVRVPRYPTEILLVIGAPRKI
eukprot:1192651-Prorocentrum_minimum.AAC.1